MVIYQADSLHERIADRGTDKLESASQKIFAHPVSFWGARGHFGERLPCVLNGAPRHEPPNITIEGAVLSLHREETLGVLHSRQDLQPIAHDTIVGQQFGDSRVAILRDPHGIEPIECPPVVLSFAENR